MRDECSMVIFLISILIQIRRTAGTCNGLWDKVRAHMDPTHRTPPTQCPTVSPHLGRPRVFARGSKGDGAPLVRPDDRIILGADME